MNQKNILKYLVPVVAVIVVAESVMLLSRVNNKSSQPPVKEVAQQNPTVKAPVIEQVYELQLSSKKSIIKKGETTEVEVKMVGNSERFLDSINVYVKYDPNLVEASKMTFDKRLPVPAFSKVSTLRSLLVANFLISDPMGLKLSSGESLSIMKFNIKGLKAGALTLEISTGKEMKESATMIVENKTSKPLGFSNNTLTINVTE